MLSDKEKRNLLTQSAYDYFCREHTLEDQVQKLTDIYLAELGQKEREHDLAGCTETKV